MTRPPAPRACPSCGRVPAFADIRCACEARTTTMPPNFREIVAETKKHPTDRSTQQ